MDGKSVRQKGFKDRDEIVIVHVLKSPTKQMDDYCRVSRLLTNWKDSIVISTRALNKTTLNLGFDPCVTSRLDQMSN